MREMLWQMNSEGQVQIESQHAAMREGSSSQSTEAKPGLNGQPSQLDCDNVIRHIAFSTLLKFALLQTLERLLKQLLFMADELHVLESLRRNLLCF
jgi:hypothetical protein